MDKIDSNISSYNHSINILERKTMVISGVKRIDTFDNYHFILDTTMGFMIIKGEELELIKLDTLSGNVTIKGSIDSLEYIREKNKSNEEGLFSRLFRSWVYEFKFFVFLFPIFLVISFFVFIYCYIHLL